MTGSSLMRKMRKTMGILLILIGIILTAGTKTPWIDSLPGDIIIKKIISAFTFLLPPVLYSVYFSHSYSI
jgi:hypothetical protein